LEKTITRWVDHYTLERYHDASDNVTAAVAYEGVAPIVKAAILFA
jgi:hypothetical protein